MSHKSYLTDYKRVAGLGVAKSGVGHWTAQRVSAVALLPLTVLFLYTFIGALGGSYEDALATYQRPYPAVVALLLMLVMFRHLRLGLQVVIEDYVSDHKAQMRAQILNMLTWRTLAIVGIFAIAKIAFSA